MRTFLVVLASALVALAQETPPPGSWPGPALIFTGKPLELRAGCRPDDLNALGLACTHEEPCAVFLELTGAEIVGTRLLVGGNLHTSAATIESILLVSEDGGRTWSEAHARLASAGFDHMQFIDLERGWIAGHVLLALPRDPFFLVSNDGGRTWRRRHIFSESRVGMIESFWFDSPANGSMIVDRMQAAENGMRYELYESATGGDTWTLRQAGPKTLPIKRRASEEAAIRVRPHAGSRAYRLEKNTAAGWQLLASFAVNAGECKPAPVVLPDPPPEPEIEPPPPAPEPKGSKRRR